MGTWSASEILNGEMKVNGKYVQAEDLHLQIKNLKRLIAEKENLINLANKSREVMHKALLEEIKACAASRKVKKDKPRQKF